MSHIDTPRRGSARKAACSVLLGVLALLAGAASAADALPSEREALLRVLFDDLTKPRPRPPNPTTERDLERGAQATVEGLPMPRRHAAAVAQAVVVGRQLADALRQQLEGEEPALLRQARETAAGTKLPRCEGTGYRSIALPADDRGPLRVYLFGFPADDEVMLLGPHHRLEMSADGRRVERITSSTTACAAVHAKRPAFAHPACAPTEFDVFLNLRNGRRFFVATESGNWVIDRGVIHFMSAAARPCRDTRLSRALDRWVLFGYPATPDAPYRLGYVYVDPQAGISVRYAGDVVLAGDERYRRVSSPLDDLPVTMRPETQNPSVALLDADMMAALGLDPVPSWRRGLGDDLARDERDVRWGRFLNRIGDPQAALDHLERWAPQAAANRSMAYELGFAFNATARYAEALAMLTAAVTAYPQDSPLCGELAFAEQKGGRLVAAAQRYPACIALAAQDDVPRRAELALNLAGVLNRLGDEAECRAWLGRAREWAVPGTEVHRRLQAAGAGDPCRRA